MPKLSSIAPFATLNCWYNRDTHTHTQINTQRERGQERERERKREKKYIVKQPVKTTDIIYTHTRTKGLTVNINWKWLVIERRKKEQIGRYLNKKKALHAIEDIWEAMNEKKKQHSIDKIIWNEKTYKPQQQQNIKN